MKKRFKRNRKKHSSDEVTELEFKVFEAKLKAKGIDKYCLRIKRKK